MEEKGTYFFGHTRKTETKISYQNVYNFIFIDKNIIFILFLWKPKQKNFGCHGNINKNQLNLNLICTGCFKTPCINI